MQEGNLTNAIQVFCWNATFSNAREQCCAILIFSSLNVSKFLMIIWLRIRKMFSRLFYYFYFILVQRFRVNWCIYWSIQYWRLWQIYRCYILIWRINKLLLTHNLYSGTNHIPLFNCSCWAPFYCDHTNAILWVTPEMIKNVHRTFESHLKFLQNP